MLTTTVYTQIYCYFELIFSSTIILYKDNCAIDTWNVPNHTTRYWKKIVKSSREDRRD